MVTTVTIAKAPPTTVTSRELSRNTGRLLDEIRASGRTLLVIRRGRPAAIMTPVQVGDVVTLEPPPEVPEVKLDALQQRILSVYSDGGVHLNLPYELEGATPSQAISAIVQLEINGLLERWYGAYRISERGTKLAAAMGNNGAGER